MKKKPFRVFKIAIYVLLLCGIGYACIYSLIAKRYFKDPVPMPFGVGASIVMSGSMEPEIATGDLVFVIKASKYEVGDVILFRSGNSCVLHRIVAIDGQEVITRGDANNTNDEPISTSDIKGVYIGKIDNVQGRIEELSSPTVLLIGAGTVVALAIIIIYYNRKK